MCVWINKASRTFVRYWVSCYETNPVGNIKSRWTSWVEVAEVVWEWVQVWGEANRGRVRWLRIFGCTSRMGWNLYWSEKSENAKKWVGKKRRIKWWIWGIPLHLVKPRERNGEELPKKDEIRKNDGKRKISRFVSGVRNWKRKTRLSRHKIRFWG